MGLFKLSPLPSILMDQSNWKHMMPSLCFHLQHAALWGWRWWKGSRAEEAEEANHRVWCREVLRSSSKLPFPWWCYSYFFNLSLKPWSSVALLELCCPLFTYAKTLHINPPTHTYQHGKVLVLVSALTVGTCVLSNCVTPLGWTYTLK